METEDRRGKPHPQLSSAKWSLSTALHQCRSKIGLSVSTAQEADIRELMHGS
jgi:hypothetical protein